MRRPLRARLASTTRPGPADADRNAKAVRSFPQTGHAIRRGRCWTVSFLKSSAMSFDDICGRARPQALLMLRHLSLVLVLVLSALALGTTADPAHARRGHARHTSPRATRAKVVRY